MQNTFNKREEQTAVTEEHRVGMCTFSPHPLRSSDTFITKHGAQPGSRQAYHQYLLTE